VLLIMNVCLDARAGAPRAVVVAEMGFAPLNPSFAPSIWLILWKWQVTPQIHLVVQNSADFYDLPFGDPVEEEVTSAPTVPGNVKRTEARHDLVARL